VYNFNKQNKQIDMKRNYIFRLIIWTLFGIVISGCTDLGVEFDDSVHIEQTNEGFTAVDVNAVLISAYSRLDVIVGSSYTGVSGLNEQTSDELMVPTRATDWGNGGVHRLLHAHTWDAAHNDILSVWNNLNTGVYYCNQILASNPNAQQAAEAKTLRAYFMYNLIDLFGQVPFREVDQGVNENPAVWNRSEAFDYAVGELETAMANLPDGGPDAADLTKVSKAFVHALLAKFYLNKAVYKSANPAGPYTFDVSDMNKVIEHCDAVQSFGFEYEENYFDNFNKISKKEKILTITTWWNGMWIWPQLHNSQGGWNGAVTLGSFYDKFEANDKRLYFSPDGGRGFGLLFGPQRKSDGSNYLNRSGSPLIFTREVLLTGNSDFEGIRVLKYDPDSDGGFVLMRYSDIRLLKAEAILRGGTATNGETAESIVKEIRTIRGASDIAVNLDVILDERGRELYWEGIRRTDQVRFGTFTKTTWEFKSITDDNLVLFPIPQLAVNSNPNLVQNPGY
jgi:hypothetical protein